MQLSHSYMEEEAKEVMSEEKSNLPIFMWTIGVLYLALLYHIAALMVIPVDNSGTAYAPSPGPEPREKWTREWVILKPEAP